MKIAEFGVATYFKIDAVSDYYFSKHEEKQKELENTQKILGEKVSELEKLPDFLLQHNIDMGYGVYNNDDQKNTLCIF